jgi:hypothetical protein
MFDVHFLVNPSHEITKGKVSFSINLATSATNDWAEIGTLFALRSP